MRKFNIFNKSKLISLSYSETIRGPFPYSIDGKNRSFLKRRRIKCGTSMTLMMLSKKNFSFIIRRISKFILRMRIYSCLSNMKIFANEKF